MLGQPGQGNEITLLEYVYQHPKLEQIRGNPDLLLATFEEFCDSHGHMMDVGHSKGDAIIKYINEVKPSTMAEFGGYYGYSAIIFGAAMRKASPSNKNLKYWSLEFNPVFASIAMNLIELAGLSDIVTVVTGAATDSLSRLKREGKITSLDILFIDHWKDLYIADTKTTESLGVLHKGSYIIADNTSSQGGKEYVEYVRAHPGWESNPLESADRDGKMRVSASSVSQGCRAMSLAADRWVWQVDNEVTLITV